MAKKQAVPTQKSILEIYIHHYTGKVQGVDVGVRIDYRNGLISLVEFSEYKHRDHVSTPGVKKWVFADREVEYMAGWLDILDAIKSAITEAKEKLETYQKNEEEQREAMIIEAAKAQIK